VRSVECNRKTFRAPCNYRFVCGTRMRKEAMRKLFYDNKFYFSVCFCQAWLQNQATRISSLHHV